MRDRTIAAARGSLRRRLPSCWCTELFQNCEGAWSLVMMRPDDDATYVITAGTDGFELADLTDDVLRRIRRHDSLATIMATAIAAIGQVDDRGRHAA